MATSETTVSLSEVDTNHLAKQALKLFSKRYGRAFDTMTGILGKSKDATVSHEEYVDYVVKSYTGVVDNDKSAEIANRQWDLHTGGHPENKVINRQQCIDLLVKGFHSKNNGNIENLKSEARELSGFTFDQIDSNSDGHISKDEYYAMCEKFGAKGDLQGVFDAMDLNGDGEISREEYAQCYEGYFLYVDEERYNHILGILED